VEGERDEDIELIDDTSILRQNIERFIEGIEFI
jgi:hypothetical protein